MAQTGLTGLFAQLKWKGELMRVSKKLLTGSAALAAAFLLALTAGATAPDASSPRDKLAVWVGHWKIHIETKETQFGHARGDDYDAKCSLLPHGSFMVCDYLSLQPDPETGRIITDLSIFYYSEVDKTFKHTGVAPEGGPHEGVVLVDGNTWTRPFEIPRRSGGVADAREIYTFSSADKHLARLEISTDKGAHWTLVNEAVGTREP
jgi:hypothetical protein